MRPYHDMRQVGGTRSMRRMFQMFGEFKEHALTQDEILAQAIARCQQKGLLLREICRELKLWPEKVHTLVIHDLERRL